MYFFTLLFSSSLSSISESSTFSLALFINMSMKCTTNFEYESLPDLMLEKQSNGSCSNIRGLWPQTHPSFTNDYIIDVDLRGEWTCHCIHLDILFLLKTIQMNLTVSCPGFQPAGQTSPCSSVYWNAWTNRRVSSTLRPTGKSFIVIWRRIPFLSIMNSPLDKEVADYNIVIRTCVNNKTWIYFDELLCKNTWD